MNNIEQLLQSQIAEGKTPSVCYMLFDASSLKQMHRSGMADFAENKSMGPGMTFHAFSVTKTFTAIAIMQLQEQGKLKLDDPLGKYLSAPVWAGRTTIRQLLTHTSGVPNPVPLDWIHLSGDHEQFSSHEFFGEIFEKAGGLKSEPGTKFMYSNLGYILLGQVIEQVSCQKYEQYVEEQIIQKAGIAKNELAFTIPDLSRHAKGYQKRWTFMNLLLGFFIDKKKFMDAPEGAWKPFKRYYVNGAAYGGLIGTPDAFVKYIQALLQPECVLLTNESRKWMFTENRTSDGKPTGMCLSWYTGMLEGKRYYTHAGGGGGYYCEIRIYPDEGIGSVVFFNRTGVSDERFLDRLDRVFFMERGEGAGR